MAFLASSAWKTGKTLSALFSAIGKRLRYAFGSEIHEKFGKQFGIVPGIVFEDIRGQGVFGLGAGLVPEDRGKRGRQLARTGRKRIEPGARNDGIDRHQAPGRLAAAACPAGVVRVVVARALADGSRLESPGFADSSMVQSFGVRRTGGVCRASRRTEVRSARHR